MKFVKKLDDVGKSIVFLDTEGLSLGKLSFDPTPWLSFRIDTYAVLKASSSESEWDVVFGVVHSILNRMTDKEKKDFALMIIAMHYTVVKEIANVEVVDKEKILEVEMKLSEMLASFDMETNLYPRIREFVVDNIPMQDFTGVGERAQDTKEMTFYRDDVLDLTTLVVLCKIMTPIFGICVETFKKKMDNAYKEIHTVAILKNILQNRALPLIEKLTNFITRIIKPMLNRMKLTHTYNGYTFSMISHQIYAAMLIRRFIAVDLFKPNGNLVTYVTSCARAAAQTQFSSIGFKTAVAEIIPPNEQEDSGDDGNISNLEAESRSSSKTADFAVIIKGSVAQLRERFVNEHDLDDEDVQAAIDFYDLYHVQLTPMNSYILSQLFGGYICGAKSMELVDNKTLGIMVAVAQAYFISQGFYDIAQCLSVVPSGIPKTSLTGNDMQLRTSWCNSVEYRTCDARYEYTIGELRWDSGLKNVVEDITSTNYLNNLAPAYMDSMFGDNPRPNNKDTYLVPESLARSICVFILNQYP